MGNIAMSRCVALHQPLMYESFRGKLLCKPGEEPSAACAYNCVTTCPRNFIAYSPSGQHPWNAAFGEFDRPQ
eukprot:5685460-Amphidinium_carterae.1